MPGTAARLQPAGRPTNWTATCTQPSGMPQPSMPTYTPDQSHLAADSTTPRQHSAATKTMPDPSAWLQPAACPSDSTTACTQPSALPHLSIPTHTPDRPKSQYCTWEIAPCRQPSTKNRTQYISFDPSHLKDNNSQLGQTSCTAFCLLTSDGGIVLRGEIPALPRLERKTIPFKKQTQTKPTAANRKDFLRPP